VYNLRLSGKQSTHYGFHTVIIHRVFEASWKMLKMHRQLNLLKKGSMIQGASTKPITDITMDSCDV
jgi:hypothetical protein